MSKLPPIRFCANCGKRFPAYMPHNSKFCPYCGKEIPMFITPVIKSVEREYSFCIYCGNFLSSQAFFSGRCNKCRKELPPD
ncbi:MAG: hypothetical protein ACFFCS_12015 [Candidatus Hodarchaeota archaeon]